MKRILMLLPAVTLVFALTGHAQLTAPGRICRQRLERVPGLRIAVRPSDRRSEGFCREEEKVLLTFFPAAFTGG
jgi:hypothetical protein